MASARYSKQKGYVGETEFVEAAHEAGFSDDEETGVQRYGNVQGSEDKGDIRGIDGWAVQVKSVTKLDIPGFMRDAQEQAGRKGEEYYGLAVKLRGKHMRDGVLILPMWLGMRVLKMLPSVEEWFTEGGDNDGS